MLVWNLDTEAKCMSPFNTRGKKSHYSRLSVFHFILLSPLLSKATVLKGDSLWLQMFAERTQAGDKKRVMRQTKRQKSTGTFILRPLLWICNCQIELSLQIKTHLCMGLMMKNGEKDDWLAGWFYNLSSLGLFKAEVRLTDLNNMSTCLGLFYA